MGDYNMNLPGCGNRREVMIPKKLEIFQIDDLEIITVNKELTTLKKEKAEETKEESLKIKETIVEEKNDSEKLKDENNG
jgi:hypothetical protein